MISHDTLTSGQRFARGGSYVPAKTAIMLSMGLVCGCDGLLEVDLPSEVTDQALENPGAAAALVNGLMGQVECALSAFTYEAGGYEDNFRKLNGAGGSYSEYNTAPVAGTCDSSDSNHSWYVPLQIGRASAFGTYGRLEGWSDQEVADRQRLKAKTALYAAVSLDYMGEFFCDMALDGGPMMSPDDVLGEALTWVDRALADIAAAGGDFELENGITGGSDGNGILTMARALRARILWANDSPTAAAADAAMVPRNFTAWVTRETLPTRRNKPSFHSTPGNGLLQGAIDQAIWQNTGPGTLGYFNGSAWTASGEWPDTIPFTGYLDLAIDTATGRAISDAGHPITIATTGSVPDTRVRHQLGLCNGCQTPQPVPIKYGRSDDIPLVSGRELWLIMAEIEGGAQAISRVNDLRGDRGLPLISGTYEAQLLADADAMENMIIEERRRELWLEGRFWATKIRHTDKLWFPRSVGQWPEFNYALQGGVRLLMPNAEYELNANLDLEDRGLGCTDSRYAGQEPVTTG